MMKTTIMRSIKSTAALTNNAAPLGGVRVRIKALDLEPIKFKLVREMGWSLERADRVESLYKGYLLLVATYPDEVHVPTEEIDEMWHAHILDTYKYMADCKNIFGYYLHHFPYLGLRGEADAVQAEQKFAATRQRFLALTGTDLAAASDCGGGCGGGCGSSCGSSCSSHCSSHTSCSTVVPATCSGGDPKPARKDEPPKPKAPSQPKTPPKKDEKKKPSIWRRIVPGLHMQGWEQSVDTQERVTLQKRPGRADLMALDGVTDKKGLSLH